MTERRPVVAMVSDAIYPYHRGGKELRYDELTRRLARRADVHVYTMHWWAGPRRRAGDAATLHAISRRLPLYAHGRRSLWQCFVFALSCLKLLRCTFDVIEADHIPFLPVLALRIVATVKRKRLVVTWHEVWGPDCWRHYLGRLGRLAWLMEKAAMRAPDHIVAASPQTAERLRRILGHRASITVAPNGIDLAEVRAAHPDAATTDLVVVGRLIAHKRIDALLDVVALLRNDGLPVTCRVIGDGPERTALHERARALGITGAVDFRHDTGEQKELYSLVKAARLAVFPTTREGFGIAVLEALACGVPVITTSAPDNLAQHLVARSAHGTVCEPSVPAIAAAVRQHLAENPVSRADSAADDWLAGYDWETIAELVAGALQL